MQDLNFTGQGQCCPEHRGLIRCVWNSALPRARVNCTFGWNQHTAHLPNVQKTFCISVYLRYLYGALTSRFPYYLNTTQSLKGILALQQPSDVSIIHPHLHTGNGSTGRLSDWPQFTQEVCGRPDGSPSTLTTRPSSYSARTSPCSGAMAWSACFVFLWTTDYFIITCKIIISTGALINEKCLAKV